MTFSKKPPIKSDEYRDRKWMEAVATDLKNHLTRSTTPILTGERWIDGSGIWRKVVDCGALPNATTKNTAHNISFSQIVRIYGITNDGTNWIPLPTPTTGTTQVVLYATATNVVLITASNLTAYTTTYVTIEYVK